MLRILILAVVAVASCLCSTVACATANHGDPPPSGPSQPLPASDESRTSAGSSFDSQAAAAELRRSIAGREQQPAEEVFKNVRLLRGMPAARLLRIMELGFSGSLGVACTHCHVAGEWASDEKPKKQIAREMWAMVGRINGELLPAIANLEGQPPAVNCSTCHRGSAKPALAVQPPSGAAVPARP